MRTGKTIYFLLLTCACLGCSALGHNAKPADFSSRAAFLFNQSSSLKVADSFYAGKTLWVKFDLTAQESDTKQVFYTKAILDFHYKKENRTIKSFSAPLEFIPERQWELNKEAKEENKEF